MKQSISQEQLLQFEQDGYMLLKNVLSEDENLILSNFIRNMHQEGKWSKAQIGKGHEVAVDLEQRGDYIHWLDEEDSDPVLHSYWQLMSQIQTTLNRHFYMGLNLYEAHLACYPSGTFYKRHRDKHKNGSTRKVSFVYYLNPSWDESKGGLLKIYDENNVKATIVPVIGHCIVFLSEIEHEVTISNDLRYSITGWFHQKAF